MTVETRILAEEAKRLKNDTAFKQFVQEVRDRQVQAFANSAAEDVSAREEAHAIIRACLLYTSPSPRDGLLPRMPSSA